MLVALVVGAAGRFVEELVVSEVLELTQQNFYPFSS